MKLSILFYGTFLGVWFLFAAPTPPPKKPVVQARKALQSELFDLLVYPVRIEPKSSAAILSDIDGVVQQILVPIGKAVSPKTPLISIKNTDPIYDYRPFIAASSIKGKVAQIEVSEGAHVTKGQRIAVVVDATQTRLRIEVTSRDLPFIRSDLKGELKVGETAIPVSISGISPVVDAATGTATVELKNGKPVPIPAMGLLGKVYLKVNLRQGIEIPDEAIAYRGTKPFVRILKDKKTHYQPVEIGPPKRGTVEVLRGLESGQEYIHRSSAFVSEAEEVEVEASR